MQLFIEQSRLREKVREEEQKRIEAELLLQETLKKK